jgi:hypothetical protein
VVDPSKGAAGGQPPVDPVKMKGLLKGLRYISQIFGKHKDRGLIETSLLRVIATVFIA